MKTLNVCVCEMLCAGCSRALTKKELQKELKKREREEMRQVRSLRVLSVVASGYTVC